MDRRSATATSRRRIGRRIAGLAAILLPITLAYLGTTDNIRVWPYRNTLHYHVARWWSSLVPSQPGGTGTLAGTVQDRQGKPIGAARVLIAQLDGTPWSAETDSAGRFSIAAPAGRYVPIAGAAGYASAAVRRLRWLRVAVRAGQTTEVNVVLDPVPSAPIEALEKLAIECSTNATNRTAVACHRRRTHDHLYHSCRPNQTTLYYTPVGGAASLPTLLTVYPGPADTWGHVSLTLAQAGYAVIATGPAYALDLEPDIDDLERLLDMLKAGEFPRADPTRIGVLGGSYSSLHVFRLLERGRTDIDAALVLGPPADLFELRRQFEAGTFFPPFGLDQALIALGFPDRAPERYWRYSPRYHAAQYNVPIMLIHSKIDEVVPFGQSQLLADELARLGKPHELHILEGMGHYLLEPKRTPAIDELFQTTLDFFARTLQPNESAMDRPNDLLVLH
jgi:pimeloyl-ACP methyl ester carboxylesterase